MHRTLFSFAIALLMATEAIALDEPEFEVVAIYEGFEVRSYERYLIAETEVEGEFEDVGNQAFRILFDYISGANRTQAEISMTAPVGQEPVGGQKISMTAPVAQSPAASDETYRIHFVMPAKYSLDTLPVPNDPRITIREVPSRLVAARRYSGFWSERRYRVQEERLLQAIEAAGLEPAGPPVYARYNSPFSIWFLRRNEVQVPVESSASSRAGP